MFGQHRRNKRADRLACQSRAERMHIRRIARLRKVANTRKMLTLVFKDTFPFVKDPPMFISKLAKDISEWTYEWVSRETFASNVKVEGGSVDEYPGDYANEVSAKISAEFPLPVSKYFMSNYQSLITNPRGFLKATKNLGRDKKALVLLGKLLSSNFQESIEEEIPDVGYLMSVPGIEEKAEELLDLGVKLVEYDGEVEYMPAKFKVGPHGILVWAWFQAEVYPSYVEIDEAFYDDGPEKHYYRDRYRYGY